jgi:hypothetical protein
VLEGECVRGGVGELECVMRVDRMCVIGCVRMYELNHSYSPRKNISNPEAALCTTPIHWSLLESMKKSSHM